VIDATFYKSVDFHENNAKPKYALAKLREEYERVERAENGDPTAMRQNAKKVLLLMSFRLWRRSLCADLSEWEAPAAAAARREAEAEEAGVVATKAAAAAARARARALLLPPRRRGRGACGEGAADVGGGARGGACVKRARAERARACAHDGRRACGKNKA
jgi:hypothetical protein